MGVTLRARVQTSEPVLFAEQACPVNAVCPEGLEPPAF
jgi:hypothetical protein